MATKASSVEDQGALNVKNLSSELSTVSKWYQLGIKLGLQPSRLHQIEQEVPTDIDRRKIEVVNLWLRRTPRASWRHIVTALREMEDLTTAERIELKYVKGGRVEDPGNRGKRSHKRHPISPVTVGESKRKKFSVEVPGDRGNESRKRRPVSPVMIGGSKRKKLPDSGVPGEDSPILSHMGTFSAQPALKQRVHELDVRFFTLVEKTRQEVNHSNVRSFYSLLTYLAPFVGEHQIHYFEGNMDAFLMASNIDKVFCQLNFYWDFLNYGLLEHIVEWRGNEELKREMVEYVADVACFRKETVLRDFVGAWRRKHETIPLDVDVKEMVLEHDGNLMDYTLEDLEQFRQNFSIRFSLSKFALMVVKIKGGCVVVTWLIPSSLVPRVREQLLECRNILDELQREHRILTLTLDGHKVPLSPPEGVSTFTHRTTSVQESGPSEETSVSSMDIPMDTLPPVVSKKQPATSEVSGPSEESALEKSILSMDIPSPAVSRKRPATRSQLQPHPERYHGPLSDEPQVAHHTEVVVSKVTLGHEGGAEIGQPHEKSTQNKTSEGYDCDFVESPPSAFQTECPKCHLKLREPYQMTCCGNSLCHTCSQQLLAGKSPCPICKKGNYNVFQDKGLNRSLKQLQVFCEHKKDGCQWRGELGGLDQHLNEAHQKEASVSKETLGDEGGTEAQEQGLEGFPFPTEIHPFSAPKQECEMAFKAPSSEVQGSLNVKNLSFELKLVDDWYQLGIRLDLLPAKLRQIERQHPSDIERHKVDMIDSWLQSTPGASWKHIATALREMGNVTTAEEIELKYIKGTRVDFLQLSRRTAFAIENQKAINEKFAIFVQNVCSNMVKNAVDIKKFLLFGTALFYPDCIPQSPPNLTEIFQAITRHGLWDSFHYSPLVRVAKTFCANDPEVKAWIQKYRKDLKAYTVVDSIKDYIESDLDTCTDQLQVDSAEYDTGYKTQKRDFVNHSLQHLTDVWEMFSGKYLVPDSPPTALIDRVRKGCLLVTLPAADPESKN